ncbi:hypothetical protein AB0F17_34445 [Nonomuraea sp. NPDC026600]|uniref:hypothetical protein n=1 Tax=Nonomuraea sp. NPDC026600 TaxID=3155363 RepID=UPI0033FBC405
MSTITTDWISWLQADAWAYPFGSNTAPTKISDLHPSEAASALQWMTWNAQRAAREFASLTIRTPVPDGVGEWWPRSPKDRTRIRKAYGEWITTTPLAVKLKKRTTFKGDASKTFELRDSDGTPVRMTWGDLRRIATSQPPDALVVLSSDREGNSFHPLIAVEVFAHFVESKYATDNEVHGKAQPKSGSKPCIVLWPFH